MTELETILAKKRRSSRGCPICGERNTVSVMVTLRMLDENGKFANGRSSSLGKSLCEAHAVELWSKLTGEMP